MFAGSRSMARPGIDHAMAGDIGPRPVGDPIGWRGASKHPAGSNDNDARAPHSNGALPKDALAIIEPWPVSATQSGRARRNDWRVRFAPRARPFVDPLTGWTGGSDPLAHVVLRFPSRDAAERYCMRQDIRFRATPAAPARPLHAPMPLYCDVPPLCCWPTGPHALCCGNYPVAQWDAGPASAVEAAP